MHQSFPSADGFKTCLTAQSLAINEFPPSCREPESRTNNRLSTEHLICNFCGVLERGTHSPLAGQVYTSLFCLFLREIDKASKAGGIKKTLPIGQIVKLFVIS